MEPRHWGSVLSSKSEVTYCCERTKGTYVCVYVSLSRLCSKAADEHEGTSTRGSIAGANFSALKCTCMHTYIHTHTHTHQRPRLDRRRELLRLVPGGRDLHLQELADAVRQLGAARPRRRLDAQAGRQDAPHTRGQALSGLVALEPLHKCAVAKVPQQARAPEKPDGCRGPAPRVDLVMMGLGLGFRV